MNKMVQGYLKGLNSSAAELPSCYKNESTAFKHGWLNGRDDRLGSPRAPYKVLLARAKLIENNTKELL